MGIQVHNRYLSEIGMSHVVLIDTFANFTTNF